jgi:hypothetical protein
VAVCLTNAKTNPPGLDRLKERLSALRKHYFDSSWRARGREANEFFQYAYSPTTLRQLLYLRESLNWRDSKVDNMLAALTLGSLHGDTDSAHYLSNQMSRTISTKPRYSVKFWKLRGLAAPKRNVFDVLQAMAEFRYQSPLPEGDSLVLHTDMRRLPGLIGSRTRNPIRCAITSPPYLNVTSFEEDQWLRLWFLGGPPYPKKGVVSRDDRHGTAENYWSFISDMWRSLGFVMDENAHVVIRIGSRKTPPDQLRRALTGCSQFSKRRVTLVSSRVTEIKKRQTDAFRPGSRGCGLELDCHFKFLD